MPQRIKVVLVTHAGGAHLGAYFPAFAALEEVESVAVVDPSNECAEMAKKALGERLDGVYKDLPKTMRQFDPTMALVSMEAAVAPASIGVALEHGCHVFAEKPSCVRAEDFERLVRMADEKKLYLMLALANRLNPEIQKARELIRAGEIGKIYGTEMHLIADQTRLTRPSYHKSWFAQKARAGGGHLIWLGIHWLDLAVYLTNTKVKQVAGFTANVGGQPIDIEDSAAVTMQYENGTLGTLTSGYYLDRGYHSHIKIWGSDGWLHIEPALAARLRWSTTKGDKAGKIQEFDGSKGPRGYTPFVKAAVRACAELQDAPISNADSLHAIKAVFAAYDAAGTGQTKKI